MIARKELKENAKATLKKFGYWNVFAVTLISGFFAEGIGSSAMSGVSSMFSSIVSAVYDPSGPIEEEYEFLSNPLFARWFIVLVVITFVFVFALGHIFPSFFAILRM